MAISARTFLKSMAGLAIVFAGRGAYAQQPASPGGGGGYTLSGVINLVRTDAALRARFAANPGAVLQEFKIDPAPYNLPERVSEGQMARLLDDLSRAPHTPLSPAPSPVAAPGPSAPVYGPPPGLPRRP